MSRERIYEINRIAVAYFYNQMLENKQGLDYWQNKRGLDTDTIKKYSLGYAKDDWHGLVGYFRSLKDGNGQRLFSDEEICEAGLAKNTNGTVYDIFRNRAMIPICDMENNVIGFGGRTLLDEQTQKDTNTAKYMNTGTTPVFKKSEHLFSFSHALNENSGQIILCEGYLDVISLNKAGFRTAVASLGTSLTEEQVQLISCCASEVICAYDNDTAGQSAIRKAVGLFEGTGVTVKVWQTDDRTVKDTDAYIRKHGAERMQRLIDNAVDSEFFMIDYMAEDMNRKGQSTAESLKKISEYIANLDCGNEKKNMCIEYTADKFDVLPELLYQKMNTDFDYASRTSVFPFGEAER